MDWTGNQNSVFKALGASNHTDKKRETQDFYATSPDAIDTLLDAYKLPHNIWECACGAGHLSRCLEYYGFNVTSTDLIDRGYGISGIDFLKTTRLPQDCECILTNPPYKYATEFVLHALDILPQNGICAMFLKTTFLEGIKRHNLIFSKHPPRYVLQFISRIYCAPNGDFNQANKTGSAVAYAWFIWEKGFKGNPTLKWIG